MSNIHPSGGLHRLRKGRWSYPGNLYFVTTVTHRKKPIFLDRDCAQVVLDSLGWLELEERIALTCAMVMPDHVHMVFQLGNKQTLPAAMNSFKGFTGKKIRDLAGHTGQVWQRQYYDHGIRNEDDLNDIIIYCYENPVRARLVGQPDEYPFWKCRFEIEPL